MAIALVASAASGTNSNGTTSSGIDTTGANLIVLTAGWFGTAPTISDSKGNTWTPLTDHATGSFHQRLYYCVSPTTGSGHTFTASGSGTFPSVGEMAFSGVNTSDALDQESAGGSTGAGSVTPGSVTPDEGGCLIVSGLEFNANLSSVGGGYAEVHVNNSGGNYVGSAIAYLIQTSAAATNPTWTWSAANGGVASSAVFHAAAGGAASGSGSPAEDADAASASALQAFTSTAAAAEAADSAASSGLEAFAGIAAPSESGDSPSASGLAGVRGPAAASESDDSASAASLQTLAGQVAAAESDDAQAAAGAEAFTGTASATETDDSAVTAALVVFAGSSPAPEAADACGASGAVTSGNDAAGSAAPAESDDAASASGLAGLRGPASAVESGDAAAASGLLIFTAAAAAAEPDDSGAGAGLLTLLASCAAAEAADAASGSGVGGVADAGRVLPAAWSLASYNSAWAAGPHAAPWSEGEVVRTDFQILKGERPTFRFTADPEADISGWTLVMYVGRRPVASGSGTPLVTVSASVVDAAAGVFDCSLTSAQTKDALGAGLFAYDVWRTDAGSEAALASGEIQVSVPARW